MNDYGRNHHEAYHHYCADLARKYDHDRYSMSLCLPVRHHAAIWAILAFAGELANIRLHVSNTTLGLIRIQWWRDSLQKLQKSPDETLLKNPVLQALFPLLQNTIIFDHLINLTYGREFDLEGVVPETYQGFLTYARNIHHPVDAAIVESIGGQGEMSALISENYGALSLIMQSVAHTRHDFCVLPQNVMARHHISLNDFYTGKAIGNLTPFYQDLIQALIVTHVPKTAWEKGLLFLTKNRLTHAKKAGFNPLDPAFYHDPFFKIIRLYYTMHFGR
jgi:NADH dehydrogenase [ubiquinone] 1 alpha subcomplex assembly factor 6